MLSMVGCIALAVRLPLDNDPGLVQVKVGIKLPETVAVHLRETSVPAVTDGFTGEIATDVTETDISFND